MYDGVGATKEDGLFVQTKGEYFVSPSSLFSEYLSESHLIFSQFWMRPNRKTLPLKLVIFCFACSSFSFIPYLTVHMKDIGITIEDIALIYLILPFANLVSNPLTGKVHSKAITYRVEQKKWR